MNFGSDAPVYVWLKLAVSNAVLETSAYGETNATFPAMIVG